MALNIKWNRRALKQFDDAIEHIESETPAGAEKVRTDILLRIDSLALNPGKYNPDKYKSGNDGSFRAFELHHYRVSYRHIKNEIRIIRIRHTKKNPIQY